MEKYAVRQVDDDSTWDRFVNESPQGTLFSTTRYLRAMEREFDRFYICKGNEIKATVALVLSDDRTAVELDDLVIYNGIMFAPQAGQKPVKARQERFELTELVIDHLCKRYSRVEIALAPQFEDARPFLWHNYHSSDPNHKFVTDLRYTSYLAIGELSQGNTNEEEMEIFKNMETPRRYNVREARKAGAYVQPGRDAGKFIRFYRELMACQGEQVAETKLARVRNLIDTLVGSGDVVIYEVCRSSGDVLYVVVYGLDKKRSYYLFGAGDGLATEGYKGTFAHWEAFHDLAVQRHITEVDMEGVNSPKRGWFKLGFGGDLRPYYQVYKGTPVRRSD